MKNGGGLIEIAGKDIVIEDIELTNLYTFDPFQEDCADGIRVEGGASNVHILNCVVHHIGCIYGDYKYSEERENFNAHGISVKGEKDAMITDVVIKGCEVYKLTTGQSESVVVNDNVEHFTVADNYIHDNDNIGIDLHAWVKCAETGSRITPVIISRMQDILRMTVSRVAVLTASMLTAVLISGSTTTLFPIVISVLRYRVRITDGPQRVSLRRIMFS